MLIPAKRIGGTLVFVLGLGAAGVGVARTVARVRGPDAPHRRVASEATAAERARGVVRGMASIEEAGAKPLPPCLASYGTGKNARHLHVNGDARVRMRDGEEYQLSDATTVEFFENAFPVGTGTPQETLDRVHERWPRIKAASHWKLRCVGPREQVWIEGCLRPGTREVWACADLGKHVILTPGGPAPRVEAQKSSTLGGAALALLGLLAASWTVAFGFRYPRELVDALAAHVRAEDQGDAKGPEIFVVLAIALLASLGTWGWAYGPGITGAVLVAHAVLFALVATRRLRVLGAARRGVVGTEVSRLHDGGDGRAEIAVRVVADAPLLEGLVPGRGHAFVRFAVTERYARQTRGDAPQISVRHVGDGQHPRYVSIEDASGRGALDLENCALDAAEEAETALGDGAQAPGWMVEVLGKPLTPGDGHQGFQVTWKALGPGDPLLIFGHLERSKPGEVGVPVGERDGYRDAATVPLVRGKPGERTMAHVGDAQELLRGVAIERRALAAALAVLVPALVAWVAFAGWFILE